MANLKGGNAIVRFLLAHGEKLGMAAVLACAGMLFWSALKLDHLTSEQQPDRLEQLATQASQHIEEFTWEGLDPNSQLKAKPIPGGAMATIRSEHFPPIDDPWTRPVLDPMQLRMDPGVLAAVDLEVHGDSGLWASADPAVIERMKLEAINEQDRQRRQEEASREREDDDDDREEGDRGGRRRGGRRGDRRNRDRGDLFGGGDERGGRDRNEGGPARNDGPVVISSSSRTTLEGFEEIKAKSWVTLIAKVPIEKQYALYDEALANASGYEPMQDVPTYRGYIVERAEVTDEGQGEWAVVAQVGQNKLDLAVSAYPFEPEELVAGHYLHPLLTHPLPPLILRDWDRRVTHSTIPLAEEEMEMMEEQPDTIEQPQPAGEEDAFAAGVGESMEGMGPPGRRGRAGRRSRGEGAMFSHGDGEGGRAGGEGGGSGRSYRGNSSGGSYTWDEETPSLLFRYFDDQVEPGHRYRYRVRLALADANNEVSEQFLDKTVTERRSKIKDAGGLRVRLTDWSEPSPVASVPMPARVYLVSAEGAKPGNINSEPEARLLVQSFNSELPAEIALEESFVRGNVLNVHAKASVMWVNRGELTPEEESQEFDFRTGITIVDLRGGEQLSSSNRDLTAPARAVLMDPAGRLFMQSELGDQGSVKIFQDALSGEEERGFGGRGGGDFYDERNGGRGG